MTTEVGASIGEIAQAFSEVPYTKIPSNEPYGPGEGDPAATQQRSMAREAFMVGDQAWPGLAYPQLDTPPLVESERRYLGLLSTVCQQAEELGWESPPHDLLYEQIARKLAEVYRHQEIIRLLGHVARHEDEVAEVSRGRAANMAGELFGDPEEGPFQSILAADVRNALTDRGSADPIKARIAGEYLALLGFDDIEAAEQAASNMARDMSYELEDGTIEIIREDFYNIFPDLKAAMAPFEGRDHDTRPIDAVPAFEAAVHAMGTNWAVRVLMGKKAAAKARGAKHEITFGELRDPFTPMTIITTPLHEALHTVRYSNAEAQEDPIRRSAFPGSSEFEEGFPVAMEQIISGQKRVPGEKYYMQLGLLKSMHQLGASAEQSFRTVYEIMWRRAALQDAGELDDDRLAELCGDAYGSVLRTTRGNARDNRDISYFNGARKAVVFLNETAKLPEPIRVKRLRWVMSGIFDPTIPDQAALYGGDPAAPYLRAA